MVCFIEILEGPLTGSRYKVENGVTIGRNSGQIIIDDAKISGKHAQVELDSKGQLVLIDLNSSNGIVMGNRRVRRIALMPGVTFQLGRTLFRVVQVDEPDAVDFARLRTWKENLAEKLPTDWVQNKVKEGSVQSFSPALKLSFIQGVQTDETLIIGYGPRVAGAETLDIALRDPDAPDLAFELIPADGLARIKNLCKNKLSLNNKPVKSEVLQDGDLIKIGTTLIKVSYL